MPPSSSQGDSLKADNPGSNSSPPTIIRDTDQQKEQATTAMLVKVVDLADTSSHIKLKTETNCRKSGGKSSDELAITKAHNRKKPTLLANSMNNPTGSQKADKLDQNKCKLTGSKQVVAGFGESLSMVASMPSPLIFSSIITAPVALATTKSKPNHRQQSKSPQGRTHSNKTSTRQSRQTPPSPANDNGEQKNKQIIGSGTNPPVGQAVTARLIDMGKRLLDAARDGQVDHVRQLVISSGAPYTSDWLGTTALHMAAQNGHLEIAEILLRNGVNRDARTKFERTALHLAAQSGSFEVVDLLLNHGSDVDARDMLKMTPLHWAVERGHLCVIERLLIGGADIEIKNKFQLTPVDIARDSKSYEIINLFKSWRHKDKDKVNFECLRSGSFSETHDILDVVDYDFSLEDNASTSRASLMLDIDEPCIDLVELEWNTLKFEPDFFLTNEDEEEPKVEYLMKVVEELQKENRQLRQRVEQLSTNPLASQLRRTHAQ